MTITKRTKSIFSLLWEAIRGSEQNFTEGSINRAIVLLSVPMILEMAMEGIFAVADIYFVGKLGDNDAVTTVGLTESMLAIVYSLGMGLSMGATAMVARRIGEKDSKAASIAAVQTLYIGLTLSLVISVVGLFYSKELLAIMGANQNIIDNCSGFTKVMLVGNITIVFLFLINGIFRGAGNASIAMWTLVVSNGLNILLDPIFIFGWGPIPAFGVEGAAIATNIGRGSAVAFQLYYLFSGRGIIKIHKEYFKVLWDIIGRLISVAAGSTMQFLIGSASWIFLYRIMTSFGSEAAAGYTFAIRVIVFAILPAWGMANAAATLVGQNLGAGNPDRAERSVYRTALFNTIFLGVVTVVFYTLAEPILELFTKDPIVIRHGTQCLKIVSLGYMFYAYGMVVNQSFNGAGDTKTPTIISFFGFWIFQIPLAYALAYWIKVGPIGVYSAIAIAESLMAIAGIIIFRMGKWKAVKI